MRTRPLLLGHRGARREAPENSLEAFELCLHHGCDGFEFDVRLCADNKSVLCHDPRLRGRHVARSKFAELGAPSLEDVFRDFAARAFLDIELKVSGLEKTVAGLVREHPPERGYFVSSFLPEVVQGLANADSSLRVGLICETKSQFARWRELPIQALFLHYSLCRASVVNELRAAGKEVFVWTVNQVKQMRAFAELGVDGVISDDTALLVETLRSGGETGGGGTDEEC